MFLPVKNILVLTSLILLGIKEAKSEFLWVASSVHTFKKRESLLLNDTSDEDEKNVLFSEWEEEKGHLHRA